MRAIILGFVLFAGSAAMASAEPVLCTANLKGDVVPLAYDADTGGIRSRLPRILGGRSKATPACPGDAILAALLPELSEDERQPFCLEYDKAADTVTGFNLGKRDDEGRCEAPRRTVCQRVNRTRDAALAIAGTAARKTFRGVDTVRNAPGGAVILSGSTQYVGQALGTMGTAAAGVAASPAVIAGAAVSVVAVGGTVYACSGTPQG